MRRREEETTPQRALRPQRIVPAPDVGRAPGTPEVSNRKASVPEPQRMGHGTGQSRKDRNARRSVRQRKGASRHGLARLTPGPNCVRPRVPVRAFAASLRPPSSELSRGLRRIRTRRSAATLLAPGATQGRVLSEIKARQSRRPCLPVGTCRQVAGNGRPVCLHPPGSPPKKGLALGSDFP